MSCYLNSGSLWLWPHTRLLCQTLGSGASYHRRLSSALQISLAPRLLTVAGECWNPPNTVDGKTAPVRSRTPTLWKFNMWWELKLGNVAERRERLLIRGNHRVPATRGPQSENQRRSWIMWAADESQNQNETWKQRTFQPRPPQRRPRLKCSLFSDFTSSYLNDCMNQLPATQQNSRTPLLPCCHGLVRFR